MTDPKVLLAELNKNLNILQEREAKYGGNAPLELLNQINDHQQAINLTKQAIMGYISQAELEEALEPLLLAVRNGHAVNIDIGTVVQGDIIGGDRVEGNKITNHIREHPVLWGSVILLLLFVLCLLLGSSGAIVIASLSRSNPVSTVTDQSLAQSPSLPSSPKPRGDTMSEPIPSVTDTPTFTPTPTRTPTPTPSATPTPDNPLLGNWKFVRYEGGTPEPLFEGQVIIKYFRFYPDGNYESDADLIIPPKGKLPGNTLPVSGAGKYAVVDSSTVRFESEGKVTYLTYSLSGNELKLTDPTAYTMVFYKIP